MQSARKSASGQRRGSSELIKEMEKLAAALKRNAAFKRGHPFPEADDGTVQIDPTLEKPEAA